MREGYTATLNGSPVSSGQLANRGTAKLQVSAPNAEPILKESQIGYGSNDLGEFGLVAHRGILMVSVDPPPIALLVTGQGFTNFSTNATARFDALPVGSYIVRATYPWLRPATEAVVSRGQTSYVGLVSDLGTLEIDAEPKEAKFALASLDRADVRLENKTPASIRFLRAGQYQLRIWRGDYLKESRLEVRPRETNRVSVAFEYGQVQLISDPPGATVFEGSNAIGQTPKVFPQLKPGPYRFRLELEGHQPATLAFHVLGTEPITVRTNLINMGYLAAMREAKQLVDRQDLGQAITRVDMALTAKPGDVDAATMRVQLEARLRTAEARSVEDQKRNEVEQRRRQIQGDFNQVVGDLKDAALFDSFAWTLPFPIGRVRPAIKRALETGQPRWSIESEETLQDGGAKFSGTGKGGLLERRRCVVMVNPVGTEEVIVQARFWDYALAGNAQVNPLGGRGDSVWTPVHPNHLRDRSPGEVAQRRKALPDAFRRALDNELK